MTPRAREMMQAYAEEMPRSSVVLVRVGAPDCPVRARIVEFNEAEITAGIQEGQRKLIVFAPDVTWSEPLREGDRVQFDGQDLYVNTVDDQRRRVDGTLIAYELRASGL